MVTQSWVTIHYPNMEGQEHLLDALWKNYLRLMAIFKSLFYYSIQSKGLCNVFLITDLGSRHLHTHTHKKKRFV